MSFAGIERVFAGMCDEEKINTAISLTTTESEQRKLLRDMDSNPCFRTPSHQYIRDIFMLRFSLTKMPMLNALRSTAASSLSLDHTFRISKYVKIQSSKGHNFQKAYSALLLVLNEKGDVVDFRLTEGQSLKDDSVTDMLMNLKSVSPSIEIIMTDNCCQCRHILQNIFEDADIKLDLWHGLNRVSRTLLKKNISKKQRFQFNRRLRNCFRQEDDHGKTRYKETPTAPQINENIDKLINMFENVIPAATIKELKILQEKHTQCLASIPKGMGTNRNENLHRSLNDFFSDKRIMTLDVAEALLTTFLFHRQFRSLSLADRPALNLNKSNKYVKKSEDKGSDIGDNLDNLVGDLDTIFEVSEDLKNII